MSTRNRSGAPDGEGGRHEHPLRSELLAGERERAEAAHEAAEHDIAEDADLSIHSPNDDLDEGETARLGEDIDLI
ncbi:MAG: hypothetical protein EOO11_14030 [Chitinophagaceae bacterium]|nr:MAG: hypothetical protein EOO11_14030 [Chitinophagaceae bacterium]